MKILHVIPSISRVHGGPSVALETMTRALAGAGVEVHVATTDDDGATALQVPLDTPVTRENVTYRFFRRQTRFYKFSFPLARWLARNAKQYDVVHIHALFSFATLPAAVYAAREHVPYIVRPLGTLNRVGLEHYHRLLKRVSFSLIEKRILERAAGLHFTSELERAQACRVGIKQPGVVIPIGVALENDTHVVRGTWLENDAPQFLGRTIFLFLGRVDPIKGFDVLLPAFAKLRAQDASAALVIAGEGPAEYVNTLRTECARLEIENAVLFAGYTQGDAKRALLRDADVFVLPSRSENQGVAVVEAMGAGLPVLVTPEVGIARDIVRCGAGQMASTSDSFAHAMLELAGDKARRVEMGARGKKLAAEKFSVEGMTKALLEMYATVLREARA